MEKLVSDAKPQMPEHPMPAIASTTTSPAVNSPSYSPQQTNTHPSPPSVESETSPLASPGNIEDEKTYRHSRAGSALMNQFQNWKRKLGAPGTNHASVEPSSSALPTGESAEMSGTHRTRTPQPSVTPLSNIGAYLSLSRLSRANLMLHAESNINQAIAACREERGNVLQNRESMQTVRESLDEGYCDVSGKVSDLVNVGECLPSTFLRRTA